MKLSEFEDTELTKEQTKKIKKVLSSVKKIWKPIKYETYYYIDGFGAIQTFKWINNDADKKLYALGNCFKTKSKARFEVEKRKLIVDIERFAKENNTQEIDWKDEKQMKYFIFYSYGDLTYGHTSNVHDILNICFTDKNVVNLATVRFGDRIRKYLLNIKTEK